MVRGADTMWICARCAHSNAADNLRCGANSLAGCGSVNPHVRHGGLPTLEPAGSLNVVPQFQFLEGTHNTNNTGGSSSVDNSSNDSGRSANGWDCQKCGNHNFAARTICNMRHCKMVRCYFLKTSTPPLFFPIFFFFPRQSIESRIRRCMGAMKPSC